MPAVGEGAAEAIGDCAREPAVPAGIAVAARVSAGGAALVGSAVRQARRPIDAEDRSDERAMARAAPGRFGMARG